MKLYTTLLLVVFQLFGLLSFAQVNLDSGLVGYFMMNGNIADSSLLATHGYNQNTSSSNGILNNANTAMSFVGSSVSSAYADTANRGVTNVATISVWVNTTAPTTSTNQYILAKYNYADLAGYSVGIKSGRPFLFGRIGSSSSSMNSINAGLVAPIVNDGNWHLIVGELNQNQWSFYVDTVLVGTITGNVSNPTLVNSDSLSFGNANGNGSYPYNGVIDQTRIYNRVLTVEEKIELWNMEFRTFDTNSVSVCNSYTWLNTNQTYTQSGVYYDTTVNSLGYDSVSILDLTINSPVQVSISPVACSSYVSPSGLFTWSTTGQYFDTLQTQNGCDSVIEVNLTMGNSFSQLNQVSCGAMSSPSGAFVMDTTGVYLDTLTSSLGCDSILEVQFTNNHFSNVVNVSSCGYYVRPSADTAFVAGVYVDTLISSLGCDSVIESHVTILNSSNATIAETACGSYTAPDGSVYLSTGTYTAILPNSVGCDSIVTIQLTINQPTSTAISPSSCGAYTAPDGVVYTSSGNYTATVLNALGCDSVISIALTVIIIDTSLTINGAEINAVNDASYSYQWVNCDLNVAIPGETNSSLTVTQNGNYRVIITTTNCVDTSGCVNMIIDNIDEVQMSQIQLYPNPAKQFVSISGALNGTLLEVYDMNGKLVHSAQPRTELYYMHVADWPKGLYLIRASQDDDAVVLKFIVE